MATFPTAVFTKERVKIRWRERYTSEALNRKFLGIPRGVYIGFSPSAAGDILTLAPDATEGHSNARVISSTALAMLDLVAEDPIDLDFTGHVAFPVYVVLKASYQVGVESSAQIVTQLAAPNGRTEIGICRVDALGPMVIVTDPTVDSAARQIPIARAAQPFGFMPGGSVEDLETAILTTSEVQDAREDIDTVIHADLKTRLDNDATPAVIAGRLARAYDLVRGIDIEVGAVGSKNVSGSFSGSSRNAAINPADGFPPAVDFDSEGSVSKDGVVTDPPSNLVHLINLVSGQRVHDTVTGKAVYGRVTALFFPHTATVTFDGGTNVSTTGDFVADGVVVGDLIQGPDGIFHEIIVVAVGAVTLRFNGAAPAGNVVNPQIRRFILTFFVTDDLGGDTPFTFPVGPTTLLAYFPAMTSLHKERFSDLLSALAPLTTSRFAPDGGTDPLTAVQANDSRIANLFVPTFYHSRINGSVAASGHNNFRFNHGPSTVESGGGADFSVNNGNGLITFNVAGTYRVTVHLIAGLGGPNPHFVYMDAVPGTSEAVPAATAANVVSSLNTGDSKTGSATGFVTVAAGDTMEVSDGGGVEVGAGDARTAISIDRIA